MPSVLSVADAKAHLNITVVTYDAELQTVIDAAEAAIGRATGPLQATATTAVVDGGRTLTLPTTPVVSLTSVTDSGGGLASLADLRATPSGVVSIVGGGSFSAPYYTVIYQAGRTVNATTNADLYAAIKELVRHLWQSQRGSGGRPGSQASDAASNTIPGAAYLLPFRVSELIAPHIQVP